MAIIETGIAWFWPDWRIRRITSTVGKDRLLAEEKNGRGVLVVCSHHLNLEITARIFRQFAKGYGVYRPNTNPAYEFIQHRGRTRFGHQLFLFYLFWEASLIPMALLIGRWAAARSSRASSSAAPRSRDAHDRRFEH